LICGRDHSTTRLAALVLRLFARAAGRQQAPKYKYLNGSLLLERRGTRWLNRSNVAVNLTFFG
jgi:hypothetical protein